MRRALVIAGVCGVAAIAIAAAVGLGRGAGSTVPRHAAADRAEIVRLASVRRSLGGAATVPQVPEGRSCAIDAAVPATRGDAVPATRGAAVPATRGGDECGDRACAELIDATVAPPHGQLVLGSRCSPQAILRGERAHPGVRAAR